MDIFLLGPLTILFYNLKLNVLCLLLTSTDLTDFNSNALQQLLCLWGQIPKDDFYCMQYDQVLQHHWAQPYHSKPTVEYCNEEL